MRVFVCSFFQLGEVVNTLCGYKTLTRQVRTFSHSPKSCVHLGTDDHFIHSDMLECSVQRANDIAAQRQ